MKRTINHKRIINLFLFSFLLFSGCDKLNDTSKEPAPLPEISQGPQIPQDKGYLVQELGSGLFWITNGVYQSIFLTTGSGVIAVDAPPGIGENYLKGIAEVTDEKVTHVIYSHPHADHISAAKMFPPDAIYIAHEETFRILSEREKVERKYPFGYFSGGAPVPLPTVTFSTDYVLEVGGQVLELSYRGLNHEPGNIFIYAPEQKVLMLVDVIDPGWIPFKSLAHADNTFGYIKAFDEVMSFDFDIFIGGHLNRPGTREDVELHGEYMSDLEESAAMAIGAVSFSNIGKEVGFANPYFLFDSYLDAVAEECVDLMLPKWTGKLGGADVFTFDNCSQMISSLRLE